MCGICGCISYDNSFPYGYLGILRLLNRGYDSSGASTVVHNASGEPNFITNKYASDENEMADVKILRHQHEHIGNLSIFHSRWRTTGGKTDENSHPHLDMYEKFSLVHNGIIENYVELRDMLISNGYEFKSETDTEVIVNLISYYYRIKNDVLESIKLALIKLEGTYALVILAIDCPNKMYAVRHGSPCLIGFSDDSKFAMIVSEVYGFDKKISKYIIVDNHDIITLEKTSSHIVMTSTENKIYENKNFVLSLEDQSCAPYKHWTMKEICEQPVSCIRAMNMGGRIKNDSEVILGGFNEHKQKLLECDNLIVLACGTSYNAGLAMLPTFKQISGFNTVQIFDGAEFAEYDIPKIGSTCFLLISQSGETKDLHICVEMIKNIREQNKNNNLILAGIVNVVDSLIAREVDCGTYLNCGREVAVASTKAFSSQMVVLTLVAIWFAQNRNLSKDIRKNLIHKLTRLQTDIVTTIDKNKEICKSIAKQLATFDSAFLLGKETFEAVAKEGSLKMKEIGYIHTESYSSSALKHGPYALLNQGFPVILLSPDDKHFSKNQMTLDELKSRGAYVIGISDVELSNTYDNKIKVPTGGYSEILFTVVMQLIAYYLAMEKGINADFPRALCKVVTTH